MSYLYLIFSTCALFLGPVICVAIKKNEKFKLIFNYIVTISILLVVTVDILPEAIEHAGWFLSLASIFAGFKLVTLLDLLVHSKKSHAIATWIVVLGFSLHAITDGIAITLAITDGIAITLNDTLLPIAIILHKIPVGAGVWFVLQSREPKPFQAITVLSIISISTILGFVLGIEVTKSIHDSVSLGMFHALMTGALIHIIIHSNNKIHNWWAKDNPNHLAHCDIK